jgi:hypothetical protein
MRHLQRHRGESAEQWLARLRRINPFGLPAHGRRALDLSIGYARYLIQKEQQEEAIVAGTDQAADRSFQGGPR